jgi:thiosulfate/3-mercaptopyruvate sulfurtransferase
MALTEIGHPDHALYDGSWAEWGASGREVVVG